MSKKETILFMACLLSSTLSFAVNGDAAGQGSTSTTTNTSNSNTTTSTPAVNATDSTSGTSKSGVGDAGAIKDSGAGAIKDSGTGTMKDSGAGTMNDSSKGTDKEFGKDASSKAVSTPSTDNQGTQTSTTTNSKDAMVNKNVNANVTEVNNKAVIKGMTKAPVFTSVELRNNVYYLPPTVTPVRGFYFLSIQSVERVCSLKRIPKVKVLSTPTTVTVIIGQKKTVLYCYDRTYFSW